MFYQEDNNLIEFYVEAEGGFKSIIKCDPNRIYGSFEFGHT
jgi:hypothetical protein